MRLKVPTFQEVIMSQRLAEVIRSENQSAPNCVGEVCSVPGPGGVA